MGSQDEQPADENRLGHLAILVSGGLEGLPWGIREAVEVQAVVPVGAPDQRQAVRADAFEGVADAALQVLIERRLAARLVIVGNLLIQDRPVAGLFQIGGNAHYQPGRIVVEIAAGVVVAAFGERLVLVIGPARRQLGGGQVEDALAGSFRHHVDETEQVLV